MSAPARYILHPTDFSAQSHLAFAHALRLALSNEATLSLLHVGDDSYEEWDRFPAVRKTLGRWGLIDEDAKRRDIQAKLGVGVEKVIAEQKDVVEAITGFFQQRPVDFMVLASGGRDGLASWLMPSKAEKIAHRSHVPTLFVPAGGHGCVSLETGQVQMDRVIVPVDASPSPDEAIERGLRAISALGSENATLTLFHVGASAMPDIKIPDGPWHVEQIVTPTGDPATEIIKLAEEKKANLIAMVTDGAHGFWDVFRGTTTDKVVRHAPCPVLAIPIDS
ncbi:universal stress protein [Rhodopirellula sp. JC639]|uniref:universal stress protein n=1 Tax=Stieleria mannarensis TaxID=2755585 RepID=UPI001603AAD9